PAPAQATELTLPAVVAAWARAVDSFKPRLKAMAREAQPVAVDGATVVLGVPNRFQKVHLPTIQAEAAAVAEGLSQQLGRPVKVRAVLDDNVAGGDEPGPATPEEPVHMEDLQAPP